MDQSITIKIAGKEYSLKASSPEMERCMRIAAEDINKRLVAYDEKYPDKRLEDKLAFVTLNETVSRIMAMGKLNAAAGEVSELADELEKYLSGVRNK